MTVLQSTVAFDGPAGLAFLLGRVLFGAILAFNGLNHFLNGDQLIGYARAKGVPAPGIAVPFTGGMLLFGGVGVALGLLPTLAAGALVVFLLVTTPLMHDFWAAPAEQQQSEMTSFLKNVAMLGGALVFLGLSAVPWPYAL
ncbi:DoxX family protein [Haloprofundus sp. MHR1]|uniref:DoxX family protein n=1 Tax=Haloprofundus sp. MHR1 TaxID=2572921 RepID=UPI0010BF2105|nr:DoxX family protein [Haloprofundus sp. MHR1]QCJ48024.1 DoxX family protein [Haloprofundus sp. MHR1]